MLYVALAEAAALVGSLAMLTSLLRHQQHAHARREDLLLNQLLHAVGRPWQPAPANHDNPDQEPATPMRLIARPEQLPDA